MKQTIFFLLLLLPITICAQKIGDFQYVLNNDAHTAEVTYGPEYLGDIIIPSTVTYDNQTYTVTSIGVSAFASSGVTSVSIPETITRIKDSAFASSNLLQITIPSSISCIEMNVFSNCKSLKSITLCEGVDSIDNFAFTNCSSLTSITFPSSMTKIGQSAFYQCGLTSINLPKTITYVGAEAFRECTNLVSATFTNSIGIINERIFYGCNSLRDITIPEGITSIDNWAFRDCTGLTKVTIPNSVISIGEFAFKNCSSLTSVVIPTNVTSIGEYAFHGCSGLSYIKSLIKNPFYIGDYVFYNSHSTAILYVPTGTKDLYKETNGWNNFHNIVEMDIKPVNETETVTFDGESDINEDTNLSGNVISNIFYNITSGNGGYDVMEGCLTITKPISNADIETLSGLDIFSDDFRNQFNGIVFKVHAGQGTVKVTAEATGNTTLMVKFGNRPPKVCTLTGKETVTLTYDSYGERYVYIYAGESPSYVKVNGQQRASGTSGLLKLYGIESYHTSDIATSVDGISKLSTRQELIYNINGQRLNSQRRGIMIVNGKKRIK